AFDDGNRLFNGNPQRQRSVHSAFNTEFAIAARAEAVQMSIDGHDARMRRTGRNALCSRGKSNVLRCTRFEIPVLSVAIGAHAKDASIASHHQNMSKT